MKTILFSTLLLCLAACSASVPRETDSVEGKTCAAIKGFFKGDLDRYQLAMDAAGKAYSEENWRVETAAADASQEKLSQLFVEVQKVTYDKEILEKTKALEAATSALKVADCPIREKLVRVKKVLESGILTDENVINLEKENEDKQNAIVNQSNAYRIPVAGEAEAISNALLLKKISSTADRKERETLYKTYKSMRAKKWLEWGFKDLLKARNSEAKAAGFANYYEYKFFRNNLDLKNYRSMVLELKTKLAPKVKSAIRKMAADKKIKKAEDWDLAFLREQSSSGEINEFIKDISERVPLDVARDFYKGLGIDIDSYKFTMDLYPRAGKNTHAFAMAVVVPHVDENKKVLPEPKMDVRFLANLKKPVKWNDIGTVIHELGHAIHAAEIRQPLSIFRGLGSVDTEAIAMTTERMAASQEFFEDFLVKYVKADVTKVRPVIAKQVKAQAKEQAFVLMRQIFFSDFEYELYNNPEADYAALWSKLSDEYWGITIDPKIVGWDVEHFLMAPVYVQNYAIGITIVEHLYEMIRREFKTSYKSTTLGGRLRREYFGPGQEFDYLDLVKRFSGKPLTAAAALKLLN